MAHIVGYKILPREILSLECPHDYIRALATPINTVGENEKTEEQETNDFTQHGASLPRYSKQPA
jgi:hypothetical protein